MKVSMFITSALLAWVAATLVFDGVLALTQNTRAALDFGGAAFLGLSSIMGALIVNAMAKSDQ